MYVLQCTVDDGIEEVPLILMGKATDALPSTTVLIKDKNTSHGVLPP